MIYVDSTFSLYACNVYLKHWFLCQVPQKAPSNDLELLKELEHYKTIDKLIADAVQRRLCGHLWYLNEANVALAFFDNEINIEMKRKMV